MPDTVGVFVDGRYLLQTGVQALLSDETQQVVPQRFNVLAFKNAARSLVEGLMPNSRILRIYWYQHEAADDEDELNRKLALAKNGMNLRTFSFEEDDEAGDSTIIDGISEDAQNLCNNGAISDALIVSGNTEFSDLFENVQAKGLRVHFVQTSSQEATETLELRTKVDTYAIWNVDRLKSFLLPSDANAREEQNLFLDPDEYGIPEIEDLVAEESHDEPAEYHARESMLYSRVSTEDDAWDVEEDVELAESSADPYKTDELTTDLLSQRVRTYSEGMNDSQIRACVQYWSVGHNDVPPMHDKSVLGACREGIQRNLTPNERKIMRDEFMRITNQQFVERNLAVDTRPTNERRSFQRSPGERFQSSSRPRFIRNFQQVMQTEVDEDIKLDLTEFVELSVARLTDEDLTECVTFWQNGEYGVPAQFDKAVMAVCRQELSRVLTEQEKFFMRAEFKRIANEIAEERGIV